MTVKEFFSIKNNMRNVYIKLNGDSIYNDRYSLIEKYGDYEIIGFYQNTEFLGIFEIEIKENNDEHRKT